MKKPPLVLISPYTQREGAEFSDTSTSVSNRYFNAIIAAGGMPLSMPCTGAKELIAEYVRLGDGVMLTGGDDVQPRIYREEVPAELAAKMGATEPERDLMEILLIDEVFRQRKPLLAICRGNQILNVALGGSLFIDIPTQVPGALNHRQMDRRCEPVHSVALTPDSDLAKLVEREELQVNSTHHQAVERIAGPLKAAGVSKDGIVEVMELKDKQMLPFLLSVQFHPERLFDRQPEFSKLFTGFVRACAMRSSSQV